MTASRAPLTCQSAVLTMPSFGRCRIRWGVHSPHSEEANGALPCYGLVTATPDPPPDRPPDRRCVRRHTRRRTSGLDTPAPVWFNGGMDTHNTTQPTPAPEGDDYQDPYYAEGLAQGRNHGAYVIDGNTSAAEARRILQGIEDCDPAVMDMEPNPLSGEWAGESMAEILGTFDSPEDEDAAANAYSDGFTEGYWAEVQDAAEAILGTATAHS